MKNSNKFLTLIALAAVVTSCKDEKQEAANKKVEEFKVYVDSVSEVATEKTAENWEAIEARYDRTKQEAQDAIDKLENKMNMDSIINKTDSKYEEYKAKVVAKKEALSENTFRNSLFTQKVNNDLNFEWVNKDNIADVYSNFVDTVDKNKKSYSRENWDEIKIVYEALDTRKNTVEKEGLSSKNNLKIAGLKVKFSTMYTINRASAKSSENQEAKK
jgi:predicted metalloenzyme YecM